MRSFPWLPVVMLAFWCVIAGIFIGEFLPLPPMPRGPILIALSAVVALGVGRAAWALRLAVRAWVATAARPGRAENL